MNFGKVALAAIVVASASTAHGAVIYSFTGASSGIGTPGGSFTFTASDFITTDRTVLASDLDSCNVTFPVGSSCRLVRFYQNSPIDASTRDAIEFEDTATAGLRFGFTDGAFSNFGSYATVGAGGVGRLTVSNSMSGPVPEPATWAMMVSGFGLIGAAMRRRRVQVSFA